MKLGHTYEITLGVEDVDRSVPFYEGLGFQKVGEGSADGRVRLTDGVVVMGLEPSRKGDGPGRTWITYYTDDVVGTLARLRENGVEPTGVEEGGARATLADPDGHRVELVRAPTSETCRGPGEPITIFGQFGEFSLEVQDVPRAVDFWNRLGFAPTQYSPAEPSGWDSLSDGALTLGIYGKGNCPHVFQTPSVTYFNQDSAERIRRLKDQGTRFTQELKGTPEPREAVLQDPDGQMFFLFSY
jgi:predicted enzyme related to lactoylglutathione lyase